MCLLLFEREFLRYRLKRFLKSLHSTLLMNNVVRDAYMHTSHKCPRRFLDRDRILTLFRAANLSVCAMVPLLAALTLSIAVAWFLSFLYRVQIRYPTAPTKKTRLQTPRLVAEAYYPRILRGQRLSQDGCCPTILHIRIYEFTYHTQYAARKKREPEVHSSSACVTVIF